MTNNIHCRAAFADEYPSAAELRLRIPAVPHIRRIAKIALEFQHVSQDAGLDYSGQYGFADTWMYWPTTHMVQPKENALQCDDCHGENGRLDWEALGYPGDPIEWGGRFDKQ